MTYEEFYENFVHLMHLTEQQGRRISKALLGPDEYAALQKYPGPMVQMNQSDPDYGKQEYMGIPYTFTKTPGITFLHLPT